MTVKTVINSNTNVTLNIGDVNIDTAKDDVIEAKLIEKVSSNHAANIVVPKVVSHYKSDVSAENSNKSTATNGYNEKDEFIATSVANFIGQPLHTLPLIPDVLPSNQEPSRGALANIFPQIASFNPLIRSEWPFVFTEGYNISFRN